MDSARFQQAADIGYSASRGALRRWLTEDADLATQHVAVAPGSATALTEIAPSGRGPAGRPPA